MSTANRISSKTATETARAVQSYVLLAPTRIHAQIAITQHHFRREDVPVTKLHTFPPLKKYVSNAPINAGLAPNLLAQLVLRDIS